MAFKYGAEPCTKKKIGLEWINHSQGCYDFLIKLKVITESKIGTEVFLMAESF